MSVYNRYLFCKKKYNDYLILVVNKNKVVSFSRDLKIIKLYGLDNLKKQNIYYLILDGLEIKLFNKGINNYFYYFKVSLVKDIIDYINNKKRKL